MVFESEKWSGEKMNINPGAFTLIDSDIYIPHFRTLTKIYPKWNKYCITVDDHHLLVICMLCYISIHAHISPL